jgi:hypothetical protein
MEHPKTTKLYKYFAKHEYVIDILKTGRIYYPKPDKFNDPFDCNIDIISSVSRDEFEQRIRSEGKELNKEAKEVEQKIGSLRNHDPGAIDEFRSKVKDGVKNVGKILKQQGVLCLSTIPDSIPMWSHYANGHNGICIELQRTPENALGSTATRPVCYAHAYPEVSWTDLFESPGLLSETVMYTKSKKWKDEHEWRVFLTKGNIFHDLPGEITGVFFGLHTLQEHKQEIVKLADNRKGIALWQAVKAPGRFQIRFVKYQSQRILDA